MGLTPLRQVQRAQAEVVARRQAGQDVDQVLVEGLAIEQARQRIGFAVIEH